MMIKPKDVPILALDVLGLAAIAMAGFVLWLWLGLLLTGASCIFLSWLISTDSS
jgi:hypothetical protein